MKWFGKRQKELYNEAQDETPRTPELSEFDKAKEKYQEIYKGCEDDTFSVKLYYVSGVTSLFENIELDILLWLLACFKQHSKQVKTLEEALAAREELRIRWWPNYKPRDHNNG